MNNLGPGTEHISGIGGTCIRNPAFGGPEVRECRFYRY